MECKLTTKLTCHPSLHKQRSKSSGLVDNVIAESRRPFSWCVALLYFRVLPLHFSKHKNSTKTNITKLNYLLKKHSKLVFILDHTPPPKMRDVDERKTSLEIVPISKISNSRGADQKYKLNCNGKAIMYRANHVMPRPALIGIIEKDKITATTIPITIPGNACNFEDIELLATLQTTDVRMESAAISTILSVISQLLVNKHSPKRSNGSPNNPAVSFIVDVVIRGCLQATDVIRVILTITYFLHHNQPEFHHGFETLVSATTDTVESGGPSLNYVMLQGGEGFLVALHTVNVIVTSPLQGVGGGDDLLDGDLDETSFGDLDGEEEDALLADDDYEPYQSTRRNVFSGSTDQAERHTELFHIVDQVQDVSEGDEIIEDGDVLELAVVDELDESELDNGQLSTQAWPETSTMTVDSNTNGRGEPGIGVTSSTSSIVALGGESDEEESDGRGSRFKTERTNIISLKGVSSGKSINEIPDSLDNVKTPVPSSGVRRGGPMQRGGKGSIRGRLGPIQRVPMMRGSFGPMRRPQAPPPGHKIHVNPHFRGGMHQCKF
ncbi:hypothetical protein J6590_059903 [Homalodisca vitripennis]|nr:hypothetical protein J6590_059903 [Homalodisca vitripennis]